MGIQPRMLDPDPESMNSDPKLWVREKGPNLLFWNTVRVRESRSACKMSNFGIRVFISKNSYK
jgi:hypothetical protein